MKAFLAYRGSGEDEAELLNSLRKIVDTFSEVNVKVYCTHLQHESIPKGQKLRTAFQKISDSDALIVLLKDGEKSEGMLLEIGYSYNKRPIYIFVEEGLEAASLELASKVYRWTDQADLLEQIKGFSE